jgi:MATE family multidrug resistance protein
LTAALAGSAHGLIDSARRIVPLAWPVFVGQVAVLAFSTVDTVMVARYSALDLAALAVGAAAYITIFVGFMGVVLAVGPIAGQLFGAKKSTQAGAQLHQAVWVALGLSALGIALLLMPHPFLHTAQAKPEVAERVRAYLGHLAIALPPALVFQAFRGFNTAVSRPKVVMTLQLLALALKVPLNALFIYGMPAWHVPAMGAAGCGLASAIAMWVQLLLAWWVLRRDPFYAPFGLQVTRLNPPHWPSLKEQLRLGIPMGLSILIEVTGFTFMAIFISRLGTTDVAGHQLAANLVSLMFMMPLAIGNATSTLVAQSLGAEERAQARRLGWHGLQFGALVAAVVGSTVYLLREPVLGAYTGNPVIVAAAMPLLAFVAIFHVADATQTIASFVMRAYRVATAPMVIYAVALWGVGLGGGYVVAFNVTGLTPEPLLGAQGFWAASVTGLVLSGVGLCALMAWVLNQRGAR